MTEFEDGSILTSNRPDGRRRAGQRPPTHERPYHSYKNDVPDAANESANRRVQGLFRLNISDAPDEIINDLPADGFSFNIGAIPPASEGDEEGFGTGLSIEFDTHSGGGADIIGHNVAVKGVDVPGGSKGVHPEVDGERHTVCIEWVNGAVTVSVDGSDLFRNLPTPGFTPSPAYVSRSPPAPVAPPRRFSSTTLDHATECHRRFARRILRCSGPDNWYYGFRNYTTDGGSQDYDPATDFLLFDGGEGAGAWDGVTQLWTGTAWVLDDAPPWTAVGPVYVHPNGNNNGNVHWAVRRWVADELSSETPLALRWHIQKSNIGGGNGVTGAIYLNGIRKDAFTIAFLDGVGATRTCYALINPWAT